MADTAGTPKDTTAATGGSKADPKNSSRKRKADELSDEETEETEETEEKPHLPAPVWGHVLDFMPYTEVRSALMVAKLIAVEAVKYVQTLNIMRGCEMYIPAARRFGNVEEVNILCLLKLAGEEDEDEDDDDDEELPAYSSISLEVSNRTVPFLVSFAKLTRGFIGSLNSNGERVAYSSYHVRGRQGEDLFRGLLSAYVGAIRTGALSQQIALGGVSVSLLRRSSCREETSNCQWCGDILSHFPLIDLLLFLVYNRGNKFCQSEQEVWDMVRRRPDIDEGFSEVSEDVLFGQVNLGLRHRRVRDQFRAAAVENLPNEKWRLKALQCKKFYVYSFSHSGLQKLDELIGKGFDPKYVTGGVSLEKKWNYLCGAYAKFLFNAWTRTTVENLAARGFPVDCDCVPVIDDKYIDENYSSLYEWN